MTADGRRSPKGKRQPKQTREELRSMLVETGRQMLREEGMGTGAETLTFKRVFERVEQERGLRLTNASIIKRVWENQAEFQTDVLVAIAANEGVTEHELSLEMFPILSYLDLSSPEARWASLGEVCRVGGEATMVALARSPNWPSWIGVWTLAATGQLRDQHRERVDGALLAGYESFAAHFERDHLVVAGRLGFRLRSPLTIRQLMMSVGALIEGCSLRDRVDPDSMRGIMRSTGPGGVEQAWTLFGIILEALVHQFFEIDPDADLSGDAA